MPCLKEEVMSSLECSNTSRVTAGGAMHRRTDTSALGEGYSCFLCLVR